MQEDHKPQIMQKYVFNTLKGVMQVTTAPTNYKSISWAVKDPRRRRGKS